MSLYVLRRLFTLVSVLFVSVAYIEFDRAGADPINVTIDDQLGDALTSVVPTYLPSVPILWQQGVNCTGCSENPDASMAKDGTWHDTTWYPGDASSQSIEIDFDGSAIYVYFILSNWGPSSTSISFTLDGDQDGSFFYNPNGSSPNRYEYNQLVYSNSELSSNTHSQHHLSISTAGTINASLILFDYALRTVDDDDDSISSLSQSAISTTTTIVSSTTEHSTVTVSEINVIASKSNGNSVMEIFTPSPVASQSGISFVSLRSSTTETSPITNSGSASAPSVTVTVSSKTSESTIVPSATVASATPLHSQAPSVQILHKSNSNTSPIIGGIAGGIGMLMLVVLFLFRKRWLHRKAIDQMGFSPFNTEVVLSGVTGEESQVSVSKITCANYFGPRSGISHDAVNSSSAPRAMSERLNGHDRRSISAGLSREEIMDQLQRVQHAVAALQSQQALRSPADAGSLEMSSHDDHDLRQRIMVLQAEMERLQATQEEIIRSNMEHLPEYSETL